MVFKIHNLLLYQSTGVIVVLMPILEKYKTTNLGVLVAAIGLICCSASSCVALTNWLNDYFFFSLKGEGCDLNNYE
jgi:hypothetical protein